MRVYRRAGGALGRLILVACAAGVVAGLAGCGGSGTKTTAPETQVLRGPGYTFLVPVAWTVSSRTAQQLVVVPAKGSKEFVSVSTFRLLKPFRPAIWPAVVKELDGTAALLAKGVKGTLDEKKTLEVAGGRARSYEIVYTVKGVSYVQRITFVLRGRSEYQLLCRFQSSGSAAEACGTLLQSFRIV